MVWWYKPVIDSEEKSALLSAPLLGGTAVALGCVLLLSLLIIGS